jgi:hypothetical protein
MCAVLLACVLCCWHVCWGCAAGMCPCAALSACALTMHCRHVRPQVNAVPLAVMFGVCAGMLLLALVCQVRLLASIEAKPGSVTPHSHDEPKVVEPLLHTNAE